MQEAQGTPAPDDGTGIMGFAIGEEHDVLFLGVYNRRRRIFSALLPPVPASIALRWLPHGRTSVVFLR
jgi:hypothetical protein